MSLRPPHQPRRILIASVLALVALGACSKKTTAPGPAVDTAPRPDTPRHALDLFRWCWEHRASDRFRELFSDDMVFTFAYSDSAGAPARDTSLTREEMLDKYAQVFAFATGIRLEYLAIDPDFPDPRAGKNPLWHRVIDVRFNLLIRTPAGTFTASPIEEFFFTRGDSAEIPSELQARGFVPDSTRWYISRWEDQTPVPVAGRAGFALWPAPADAGRRADSAPRRGFSSPLASAPRLR